MIVVFPAPRKPVGSGQDRRSDHSVNEPVNTVIGIDSTVIEQQWPGRGNVLNFECAGTEEL